MADGEGRWSTPHNTGHQLSGVLCTVEVVDVVLVVVVVVVVAQLRNGPNKQPTHTSKKNRNTQVNTAPQNACVI